MELNAQTMSLVALLLTALSVLVLICLVCFSVVLLLRRTRESPNQPLNRALDTNQRGPFCSHCGKLQARLPDRAIALTDTSYLVYRCPYCAYETLMPHPSAE